MGVRERTQSKRKPTQRKMKIPLVLLVACVASLQAASLMDVTECPAECCPTTTNAPTTTADPAPTEAERDATGESTTANICDICDQSTCEQGEESGAGSASLSLLALLLPAVFARLL